LIHPIVFEYMNLISSFLSGDISAHSFQNAYIAVHYRDDSPASAYTIELGDVLSGFFFEVDAYVQSGDVRGEKDLDDDQLREVAEWALARLRELTALG
jgi:hypothetical protein